jgi:hypothetical protein
VWCEVQPLEAVTPIVAPPPVRMPLPLHPPRHTHPVITTSSKEWIDKGIEGWRMGGRANELLSHDAPPSLMLPIAVFDLSSPGLHPPHRASVERTQVDKHRHEEQQQQQDRRHTKSLHRYIQSLHLIPNRPAPLLPPPTPL